VVDNSTLPNRRSIRLLDYDYSQEGGYFITLCTQQRLCLLAEIVDRQVHLSPAGQMLNDVWASLPARFPGLLLDAFEVMPDHVHAVLTLTCTTTPRQEASPRFDPLPDADASNTRDRPPLRQPTLAPHGTLPGTVGRITQAFKSLTSQAYTLGVKNEGWQPYPGKLWQRNYYERIIRNQLELNAIRQYIQANPAHWSDDTENPGRLASADPS
jgi:putative transposase